MRTDSSDTDETTQETSAPTTTATETDYVDSNTHRPIDLHPSHIIDLSAVVLPTIEITKRPAQTINLNPLNIRSEQEQLDIRMEHHCEKNMPNDAEEALAITATQTAIDIFPPIKPQSLINTHTDQETKAKIQAKEKTMAAQVHVPPLVLPSITAHKQSPPHHHQHQHHQQQQQHESTLHPNEREEDGVGPDGYHADPDSVRSGNEATLSQLRKSPSDSDEDGGSREKLHLETYLPPLRRSAMEMDSEDGESLCALQEEQDESSKISTDVRDDAVAPHADHEAMPIDAESMQIASARDVGIKTSRSLLSVVSTSRVSVHSHRSANRRRKSALGRKPSRFSSIVDDALSESIFTNEENQSISKDSYLEDELKRKTQDFTEYMENVIVELDDARVSIDQDIYEKISDRMHNILTSLSAESKEVRKNLPLLYPFLAEKFGLVKSYIKETYELKRQSDMKLNDRLIVLSMSKHGEIIMNEMKTYLSKKRHLRKMYDDKVSRIRKASQVELRNVLIKQEAVFRTSWKNALYEYEEDMANLIKGHQQQITDVHQLYATKIQDYFDEISRLRYRQDQLLGELQRSRQSKERYQEMEASLREILHHRDLAVNEMRVRIEAQSEYIKKLQQELSLEKHKSSVTQVNNQKTLEALQKRMTGVMKKLEGEMKTLRLKVNERQSNIVLLQAQNKACMNHLQKLGINTDEIMALAQNVPTHFETLAASEDLASDTFLTAGFDIELEVPDAKPTADSNIPNVRDEKHHSINPPNHSENESVQENSIPPIKTVPVPSSLSSLSIGPTSPTPRPPTLNRLASGADSHRQSPRITRVANPQHQQHQSLQDQDQHPSIEIKDSSQTESNAEHHPLEESTGKSLTET